jgi:hypothetical protein
MPTANPLVRKIEPHLTAAARKELDLMLSRMSNFPYDCDSSGIVDGRCQRDIVRTDGHIDCTA